MVYSRETSDTMIFLSASNPGQRAVTLSSHGFAIPRARIELVFPRPEISLTLPYELLPGKSCNIGVEEKEMAQALKSRGFSGKVKLIGIYRDQINNTYKSKSYEFDVEEWNKET